MGNTERTNLPPEYPPTTAVPTHPAVQRAQETGVWFRNKPQSNSVGAAALIFISGGMFMVGAYSNVVTNFVKMSWFIGGIVGAIIGAIACNKIQKKLITCFAALLVTVSGVLLAADPDSHDSLVSARFINGCALGLVFPLTLVLAGEETVKYMRGLNAVSVDAVFFSLGVFLQIIYSYAWSSGYYSSSFNVTQLLGCFSILWGFISFIIAYTLQIESPLLYLSRGQEQLAIDTLRRLQRPFTVTYETYEQLEELKLYLAESKERPFMQSARMGLPALLKLCFYRSFMALSISYDVNLAMSGAVAIVDPDMVWSFYMYGFLRWMGTSVVLFTLDRKGRKPPIIVGFFVCACLSFAVGGIFTDGRNFLISSYMEAVVILLVVYQFFAGLSTASSSAYLAEAFPLAVKPYYIAIVFIVEMMVHIIIIACSGGSVYVSAFSLSNYFYAVGGLSMSFFIVALIAMPETKMNTLRECLAKFQKCIHYRT